jgi:hypothetical protein
VKQVERLRFWLSDRSRILKNAGRPSQNPHSCECGYGGDAAVTHGDLEPETKLTAEKPVAND